MIIISHVGLFLYVCESRVQIFNLNKRFYEFNMRGQRFRSKYRNWIIQVNSYSEVRIQINDNAEYSIVGRYFDMRSLIFDLLRKFIHVQPTQHSVDRYLHQAGFAKHKDELPNRYTVVR